MPNLWTKRCKEGFPACIANSLICHEFVDEKRCNKTSIDWWIFALVGLLALEIALLTVSWQSWKVATRNPVEALRYD